MPRSSVGLSSGQSSMCFPIRTPFHTAIHSNPLTKLAHTPSTRQIDGSGFLNDLYSPTSQKPKRQSAQPRSLVGDTPQRPPAIEVPRRYSRKTASRPISLTGQYAPALDVPRDGRTARPDPRGRRASGSAPGVPASETPPIFVPAATSAPPVRVSGPTPSCVGFGGSALGRPRHATRNAGWRRPASERAPLWIPERLVGGLASASARCGVHCAHMGCPFRRI